MRRARSWSCTCCKEGQKVEGVPWKHTAKQVGIALEIFEKVHAKRFSDLGVEPKIDALSRRL
jgi:hypothetical protein